MLLGNVVILKTFLPRISSIIHFFINQKFWKYFFVEPKISIEKTRQLTIQIFIFYLIYSGTRKAFHKVMQHEELWFIA